MNKKIKLSVLVCVVAAFTAGCANAAEPPKCSDDKTLSLVRKILGGQIGGALTGKSDKALADVLIIETPRATDYAEKIKKYRCTAIISVNGQQRMNIRYESQLDDGGKHVVALEDVGRANLAQMNMYASDDYKKMKANPQAFAKETSARITAREILRNALLYRQIGDIASAESEEARAAKYIKEAESYATK